MKIVVMGEFDTERMTSEVSGIAVTSVSSAHALLREVVDAEVLINFPPAHIPEILSHATQLRWMHTSVAGVDRLLCRELVESDIVLTCAKDGPAGPNLADHAMALCLALARGIGRSARANTWSRKKLSPGVFELGGRTAGIAGYGSAGREIAKRALGFGMKVLATKRKPPFVVEENMRVLPAEDFELLLVGSDVVFNCLPETSETVRLFDGKTFDKMKPRSLFINIGRATTVETDALVDALASGKIGGAGLDVIDPEPLPDDHALWGMHNVVITPHIAGASADRAVRNRDLVVENLHRYMAGKELASAVDKKAGY